MDKKALILPSNGIGDGLILMTISYALKQQGYEVSTLHPFIADLKEWFPEQNFIKMKKEEIEDSFLKLYDIIIAVNDNSAAIKKIKSLRNTNPSLPLTILYPTYNREKHGLLHEKDQVFNPTKTMVENLALYSRAFYKSQAEKSNGLLPPPYLYYKRHKKRVIIHPFSSEERKNWPLKNYLKLAHKLKIKGFKPCFIMEKVDEPLIQELLKQSIPYVAKKNLSEIAEMIYESGFVIGNDSFSCHLASNLNIPYLVIADSEERLRLWGPGWGEGKVVTLQKPFSYFRYFQRRWEKVLSVKRVFISFLELSKPI